MCGLCFWLGAQWCQPASFLLSQPLCFFSPYSHLQKVTEEVAVLRKPFLLCLPFTLFQLSQRRSLSIAKTQPCLWLWSSAVMSQGHMSPTVPFSFYWWLPVCWSSCPHHPHFLPCLFFSPQPSHWQELSVLLSVASHFLSSWLPAFVPPQVGLCSGLLKVRPGHSLRTIPSSPSQTALKGSAAPAFLHGSGHVRFSLWICVLYFATTWTRTQDLQDFLSQSLIPQTS